MKITDMINDLNKEYENSNLNDNKKEILYNLLSIYSECVKI
jgi:hypothetical protein